MPLSGPYAQNGRDILNGFLLYLEEIGYRAGGRQIELDRRRRRGDSRGGADEGAKARRAGQGPRDGRRAAVVDRLRARAVHRRGADSDAVPGRVRRRPDAAPAQQVDRADGLDRQPAEPRVRRVRVSRAEAAKVATIALDYAFGWESVGGFQRTFEAEGGAITQKIWARCRCTISRRISRRSPATSTRCTRCSSAAPALQFMRQYQEFGLKQRVPLIGGGTTTDEHVLPFMGDEALGVDHGAALQRGAGHAGEQDVRGGVPRALQEGAELLLREHVHGRQVARRGASRRCTATSRTRRGCSRRCGNVKVDRRAARAGGARRVRQSDRERLHPQGRARERRAAEHGDRDFPRVSQFWKYNPADYLKQPLYSR